MKKITGYLIDRATGLGVNGKVVAFTKLDGTAVTTATTYAQSMSATTDINGRFEAWFELSPGPVNIKVTASASEFKIRKHDELAQMGVQWSSDIKRMGRALFDGVIDGFLNELAVTTPSGHNIVIATGGAIIDGSLFSIENGAMTIVGTANSNASLNPRIDLVTLRQYKETAAGQNSGRQEVVVTLGTVQGVIPSTPTSADFVDLPIAAVSTAYLGATKTVFADLRTYSNKERTPVGTVAAFAGSSAPEGWLICDGSAVSRVAYQRLFDLIGTTYGAGNGTTTFNIPDLRGRIIAGRDASQTEFDVLGEGGGAKDVTLTAAQSGLPAHTHTAAADGGLTPTMQSSGSHTHTMGTSGTHNHTIYRYSFQSANRDGGGNDVLRTFSESVVLSGADGDHTHTVNSGGSHTHTMNAIADHTHAVSANAAAVATSAHSNLQPYRVLNHIIKT